MRKALVSISISLLLAAVGAVATGPPAGAATMCAGRVATIVGTTGDDDLVGTTGNDVIVGLGGNDVLRGLEGNDVLCGSTGNDRVIGSAGDDVLTDEGNDDESTNVLMGGAGNDSYIGGVGHDTADFSDPTSGATSVQVDLGAYYALGQGLDEIGFVEDVRGTAGSDTIYGDGADNTLYGLAGTDRLFGGGGTDVLHGGQGDDALDGQTGYDRASYAGVTNAVVANLTTRVATGDGNDTLDRVEGFIGGRGNDRLTGWIFDDTIDGGPGNDVIDGQGGNDWAVFDSATAAITADLAAGTATGQGSDTLARVENLRGGPQPDQLRGNDAANTLVAGAYDFLEGRGGPDVLTSVPQLLELPTATISYASAPGKVTVDLSAGSASGAAGDDLIRFSPLGIIGSNFSDRLVCPSQGFRCTVDGLKGDDTIIGTPGNDDLYGRLGNDRITGGDGPDTAHFEGTTPVAVDLVTGRATGQGTDTLVGMESAIGSSAADSLTGAGGPYCFVTGGPGNDTLRSAGSECSFHGSDGNDTIVGTEARDGIYAEAGNDVINARGGDDEIVADAGDDRIDGGAGLDRLDFFTQTPGPVNANLATGVVNGLGADTVVAVENLRGSSGNDTIRGTDGPNIIDAGSGDDTLYGGGGDDQLWSGVGDNVVQGGPGKDLFVPSLDDDSIFGGPDADTVSYAYSSLSVTVDLVAGTARGQGTDLLTAVENITGFPGRRHPSGQPRCERHRRAVRHGRL